MNSYKYDCGGASNCPTDYYLEVSDDTTTWSKVNEQTNQRPDLQGSITKGPYVLKTGSACKAKCTGTCLRTATDDLCTCDTGYALTYGTGCTDLDGCQRNPCFAGVPCIDAAAPALGKSGYVCKDATTGTSCPPYVPSPAASFAYKALHNSEICIYSVSFSALYAIQSDVLQCMQCGLQPRNLITLNFQRVFAGY